jgi:hypothetical protein
VVPHNQRRAHCVIDDVPGMLCHLSVSLAWLLEEEDETMSKAFAPGCTFDVRNIDK